MNNEIKNEILSVKATLLENPKVKEYLSLKDAIEKDEEIKQLREEIRAAQKELSLSVIDEKTHQEKLVKYNALMEKYNSHPLINNYLNLSEEIRDLLLEMKNILE